MRCSGIVREIERGGICSFGVVSSRYGVLMDDGGSFRFCHFF